jgi:hypothetical protein
MGPLESYSFLRYLPDTSLSSSGSERLLFLADLLDCSQNSYSSDVWEFS